MDEGKLDCYRNTRKDKELIWQNLGLTEAGIKQSVHHIVDWLQKQSHLAEALIDNEIVEKMLIMSKGSVERTKQQMDKFYSYRSWAPELIQNRESVLKVQDKVFSYFGMPVISNQYEGKRVAFLRFIPNLTSIDAEDLFKKAFMIADIRLKFDYWLSDIWVVDLTNLHIGLVLSIKLNMLRKALQLFQYGLKWRLEAIHLVNIPMSAAILQRGLDFLKQFASSKLMNRIVVHDSLDTLYKCVPKEYLPTDLGGVALSFDELIDTSEDVFRKPEVQDFLIEYSKMVSDDGKREKQIIEEMSGSFKQLEFD